MSNKFIGQTFNYHRFSCELKRALTHFNWYRYVTFSNALSIIGGSRVIGVDQSEVWGLCPIFLAEICICVPKYAHIGVFIGAGLQRYSRVERGSTRKFRMIGFAVESASASDSFSLILAVRLLAGHLGWQQTKYEYEEVEVCVPVRIHQTKWIWRVKLRISDALQNSATRINQFLCHASKRFQYSVMIQYDRLHVKRKSRGLRTKLWVVKQSSIKVSGRAWEWHFHPRRNRYLEQIQPLTNWRLFWRRPVKCFTDNGYQQESRRKKSAWRERFRWIVAVCSAVFWISELLFIVSFHHLHRTGGDIGRCRALAVMSPPFLDQRNCCMVKLNFDISRLSTELSLVLDWLFIRI